MTGRATPDRGFDWRQPGGWIYNILPYIEQQALHDLGAGLRNGMRRPEDGRQLADGQTPLTVLYCPTRRARPSPIPGRTRQQRRDARNRRHAARHADNCGCGTTTAATSGGRLSPHVGNGHGLRSTDAANWTVDRPERQRRVIRRHVSDNGHRVLRQPDQDGGRHGRHDQHLPGGRKVPRSRQLLRTGNTGDDQSRRTPATTRTEPLDGQRHSDHGGRVAARAGHARPTLHWHFRQRPRQRLQHGLLRRLGADDQLHDRPDGPLAIWATARTARRSTARSSEAPPASKVPSAPTGKLFATITPRAFRYVESITCVSTPPKINNPSVSEKEHNCKAPI